jgi:hypothetical protein
MDRGQADDGADIPDMDAHPILSNLDEAIHVRHLHDFDVLALVVHRNRIVSAFNVPLDVAPTNCPAGVCQSLAITKVDRDILMVTSYQIRAMFELAKSDRFELPLRGHFLLAWSAHPRGGDSRA